MDVAPRPKQLVPDRAEKAYDLLNGYRFAERYTEGKTVADICWREVGYGTCLLAKTAGSVAGLVNDLDDASGALELARSAYSAPNIHYGTVSLPELPYSREHFDVVVAFGVIEKMELPMELLVEAKRVLKEDGVLVISTPDKRVHSNDRNHRDPSHRREMYLPEFKELLERSFGRVELYRQGAVAGSVIYRENSSSLSDVSVESTRFTVTEPSFDDEPPEAGFILAVCSDAEILNQDERPHLLLDGGRRLFDECDDHREDVQLLRNEIERMQDTEVQAFQDTFMVRNSEISYLESQLERTEAQLQRTEARMRRSESRTRQLEARLHEIETSNSWRLLGVYRSLRTRLGSLKSSG